MTLYDRVFNLHFCRFHWFQEWDLKLKQTDKSVQKWRMELEKLNKERVAIAGKLNKLELEHSRMREQFNSDFSQKMEGLDFSKNFVFCS